MDATGCSEEAHRSLNSGTSRRHFLKYGCAATSAIVLAMLIGERLASAKALYAQVAPSISGVEQGPSYVISISGSTYIATNQITQVVDYSGTSAAEVMQKTLDALINGGKLLIAQGTYPISRTIDISNQNIVVSGTDTGTILRMTNGANLDFLLRIVADFTTVSDLTVDSNRVNQSSGCGYGIAVVDRDDCTIRNARLINGRRGGLCLQGAKRCTVIESLIQNVGSTSIMANGIYIYGDSWASSDDNTVTGCLVDTVSKWGVQIQGSDATHLAQRNKISDTIMTNCGTPVWSGGGLNLYAGANDNIVDGCIVHNCTAFGVEIYPATDTPVPVGNSVLNTVVINHHAGLGDSGTAFEIDHNTTDNVISNCVAYNADRDGFAIVTGATRNRLEKCGAMNTRDGYLLWNAASENVIRNSCGFNCKDAGINISTSDCRSNVITCTDTSSCTTPISDSGTGTSIDQNPPTEPWTPSMVEKRVQDALEQLSSRLIAFSSLHPIRR